MGTRKRYTDEERALYVAMLDREGYPHTLGALKKVAEFANVHTNVLRRWWRKTQNPPPTELVTQKKADIEERLKEAVHLILDVLLTDAIEEASPRELFTGLGIAIDKLQLVTGKPTERYEHIDHSERVDRLAAIFNAARERRSLQADLNGDSDVVIH